jgi:hypothetical protein
MGFEFKIMTTLSVDNKREIEEIIKKTMDKSIEFSDEVHFEDDGIYVCKYRSSNFWEGLESIKEYLDDEKIRYKTEEL